MNTHEPKENVTLRPLLHQLLVSREDEKRATALFLHDEIAQCLAIVSLQLSILNKQHGNGPQTISEGIQKVQEVLKTAQAKVRGLEYRLYPKVIEYSVTEAIKGYIERLRSEHGYCIDFVSPATVTCGKKSAVGLYRVVETIFASSRLQPSVAWEVALSASAADVTVSVAQTSAPADCQEFLLDGLTVEHIQAHGGQCRVSVPPVRIEAVFPLV
jgi:signal transduction histidine kinase